MFEFASDSVFNDAMLLLRVEQDFVHVFQGAGSIRKAERDFRGCFASEIEGEVGRDSLHLLLGAIDEGQPVYVRFVSEFSRRHAQWERLILPLASDDDRKATFVLILSLPLDDRFDILKVMYDRMPIGMIAASPATDGGGGLNDARIVLMNAHARRLLKLNESAATIHTVRELGSWFRTGANWTRTGMAIEGGSTQIYYRDDSSSATYTVCIEPLERFVLFSITEDASDSGAVADCPG